MKLLSIVILIFLSIGTIFGVEKSTLEAELQETQPVEGTTLIGTVLPEMNSLTSITYQYNDIPTEQINAMSDELRVKRICMTNTLYLSNLLLNFEIAKDERNLNHALSLLDEMHTACTLENSDLENMKHILDKTNILKEIFSKKYAGKPVHLDSNNPYIIN